MFSYIRMFGIALWTVLCITFALLVLLVTFNRGILLYLAHALWSPGIVWMMGVKLEVEGLENLEKDKPYVFVSNHQSFADIPCIMRGIPRKLHFVAKNELKKLPFVGWFIWASGMIFIDRSNRAKSMESLQKAGKLVAGGKDVLTFPEGTRHEEGKMGQFKRGAFLLAQASQVEIVPIRIRGASTVWPANTLNIRGGKITLTIGKPQPMTAPEGDVAPFANEMREKVLEL